MRSCCFQGAVAAMGPARTPLLRPAWLVAFLDRPKTPSEAPRTPEAQRGHHQKSGTDVQQRLECGSKTAPHCPHIPQCGGLRAPALCPGVGDGLWWESCSVNVCPFVILGQCVPFQGNMSSNNKELCVHPRWRAGLEEKGRLSPGLSHEKGVAMDSPCGLTPSRFLLATLSYQ